MFEANDIREWRGHDVVDAEGHKIGALEAVYVDTSTDQPAFATVTWPPCGCGAAAPASTRPAHAPPSPLTQSLAESGRG